MDDKQVILALDLGTRAGFAVGSNQGNLISGTWDLKPSRFDGGGMRFLKFRKRLDEISAAMPFARVVYEEVRAHKGTDAAHIYGGLMATLQQWCEERSIPYQAIPVQAIKKHVTGKGNADKKAMIEMINLWGFRVKDDNEADAIGLLDYVLNGGGE